MKISEIILQQGINRRFRGPRKPRLKQKGFHKRMKGLEAIILGGISLTVILILVVAVPPVFHAEIV